MLYCRTCGQCLLIDPDQENGNFYFYQRVRAWQYVSVNAENGMILDYGDTDDYESEASDESMLCPYCEDNDIDINWNGTLEEAMEIRESYNIVTRRNNVNNAIDAETSELRNAGVITSEWDDDDNREEKDNDGYNYDWAISEEENDE